MNTTYLRGSGLPCLGQGRVAVASRRGRGTSLGENFLGPAGDGAIAGLGRPELLELDQSRACSAVSYLYRSAAEDMV